MKLSAPQFDRLYQRVLRRDRRLDGRVWMAVRTTGIYCRPSCAARRPRPENVRFFFSPGDAQGAGFRACRRCRPELPGGRAGLERAELRRWLQALSAEDAHIAELARAGGRSPSQLYRMFRRHLGRGPRDARAQQRLARACALLRNPGSSVARAALEAGFGSLATFYRWFRRAMGTTPVEYRRRAAQRLVS